MNEIFPIVALFMTHSINEKRKLKGDDMIINKQAQLNTPMSMLLISMLFIVSPYLFLNSKPLSS